MRAGGENTGLWRGKGFLLPPGAAGSRGRGVWVAGPLEALSLSEETSVEPHPPKPSLKESSEFSKRPTERKKKKRN